MDKDFRPQAVTFAKAILAEQKKIESQLEEFERMPLTQTVTSTVGDKVIKPNPAVAEFRALVRDYASNLRDLSALAGKEAVKEVKQELDPAAVLAKIRAK